MNLYEIANNHNQALMALADMDDVPEEAINDTLEALQGEFEDKAISVAGFFMNMDADIKAMKDAEKRIADRRKAKENQVARLKDYLLSNMVRTGITVIECPHFKISIRNNPESVQVLDESLIPAAFKEKVVEFKIDKKKIKDAGGCDGVELVRSKSLSIK